MAFWRQLGDLFRNPYALAADNAPRARFDSAPMPIDQAIAEAKGLGGSPRVSRVEALSVPAVQRGRNMICSVSTLPLVQYGPELDVVRNPLLEQIDPDVANVVTLAQTLEDLLFDGISWWRVTGRGFDNFPSSATHLDPGSVSLTPPVAAGKSPSPLPSGEDPRGACVYVDGVEVPAREIIRFDSPNPAVLHVGGRAIRRAILLDKAAGMYADDPRPLDYFTPGENADEVDDDEVLDILGKWKNARKRRSTAWVPSSMKYNSVDTPSPQQLQLVELQRQVALDIANALGVDPEDLGISTTSRTYANAVDRRRDRVNDVLSTYMRAITDRLSMGDVTRRGYTVGFDLDDYMRANPTERVAYYGAMKDMGAMTVEEIRSEEKLPPLPLSEPVPDTVPVDASRRAAVTFDAPQLTFADVDVVGFSVDRASRTIEGTILPYGKVGTKMGLRFRFDRGALQWSDPTRVKLNMYHDSQQTVGYAESLIDAPQGTRARFKVARGEDGDRALSLAEDKVLDGFSVGVDFDAAADTVPDPKDRSVVLVRRADLRHVALTPEPSFDDARVTKVAASRTEGNAMPCTTCGQVHADGVACTANPTTPPTPAATPTPAPASLTFSADQLTALLAQPNGMQALQALMGATAPVPAPVPEGPTIVNPTRLTASVSEPTPYVFDRRGNLRPGTHEFSGDLISGLRDGDKAAYDRAMTFVRAQFDVITTDVNELNPVRNRPEMYVDQRSFRYPIWEAVNKGTLADITAFTFPKFNTASGLVGAHTEGTEPTSGTFTVTNQTVTPTALSGKAKISRETWDQGGNPQIGNLIWNQMLKGWYEALEAAAVAVLDAASPTQIDLSGTPGLANDDLDQAITAAFAALQFVRGGFTMDNAFTQIDLYKALVAAVGTDGRRLYPALGPTNAGGQVASRFGSLDVNGVIFHPAWALAATGAVAASSYLFDSDSVHGWASAPQRLTIDQTEVANVYIGLWGYKAAAISDINGVREIVYDPS